MFFYVASFLNILMSNLFFKVAVQCLQTAYDFDPTKESKDDVLPFTIEEIFQTACLSLEVRISNYGFMYIYMYF